MTVWNVCVVGAGVAGLAAAERLAEAGEHSVLLLDKGRSVGGRMATRRMMNGGKLDHGAQFMTARSALFEERVIRPGLESGELNVWFADRHERYFAPNGMNSWMKTWASKLPSSFTCLTEHQVNGLAKVRSVTAVDGGLTDQEWLWSISFAGDAKPVLAKRLLLTMPVPQALALLPLGPAGSESFAGLHTVQYDPCIALLITLNGASSVPAPGCVRTELPAPISWVADNQQKGVSALPQLTVHADGAWSRTHYETTDEQIKNALMPLLKPWFGAAEATETVVKRWRFALASSRFPAACFTDSVNQLWMAGDGFMSEEWTDSNSSSGRVETAFLSGWAAASQMIDH